MKVAVVSGASGGIGKETARLFVENGYFTVAIYNRGETQIQDLSLSLKNEGKDGYLLPVRCDLNSEREIREATRKIAENFSHVDVFVSCAGVDLFKLFTDTTEKEWDEVFSVNVKSAFMLSKFCLESMIERKEGKIVFVSSVFGEVGASMETAYSASKAALIGLTKSLAKEVGPSGINVNCVCPGIIDTKMNARLSEEELKAEIEKTPLNRIGTPKEIAEIIYFLCEEKSSFITGRCITPDGGYTL